jgi:hypothetical protein
VVIGLSLSLVRVRSPHDRERYGRASRATMLGLASQLDADDNLGCPLS